MDTQEAIVAVELKDQDTLKVMLSSGRIVELRNFRELIGLSLQTAPDQQ